MSFMPSLSMRTLITMKVATQAGTWIQEAIKNANRHNRTVRRKARRTREEVGLKQSIHLRPSKRKSNSRTCPTGRRARWQQSQNAQETAPVEETRKSLSAVGYSSTVSLSCHLPYLARFQDFTLHYQVARDSESRCGANFVLRAWCGDHMGYYGFGHRRESSALCPP